jgi:hypothetical protein
LFRAALGTEPPQVDERAEGGIKGTVGAAGDLEGEADDAGELGRDLERDAGRRAVEAGEFAVGLIVRHLAVEFNEAGVDLHLERGEFGFGQFGLDQFDRVNGAHRAAFPCDHRALGGTGRACGKWRCEGGEQPPAEDGATGHPEAVAQAGWHAKQEWRWSKPSSRGSVGGTPECP